MSKSQETDIREKIKALILEDEEIIDLFEDQMVIDGWFQGETSSNPDWEGLSPQEWLNFRLPELNEAYLLEIYKEAKTQIE